MSKNMQMLPSDAKCITSRDGSTGYIFGGILNNTVTNALFVFNSTTSQVSRVNTRIKSMQYRNLSRCLSSCSNTACNYSVEQFSSSLWRERCQWQIFERFVVIPPIGQYMVTGIVTIADSIVVSREEVSCSVWPHLCMLWEYPLYYWNREKYLKRTYSDS